MGKSVMNVQGFLIGFLQDWVAKFEKPKGDPSAFLKPATTVLSPYLKVSEMLKLLSSICMFAIFFTLVCSNELFPPLSFNFLFNFYGSLGVSLPGTSINVFKKYIKMSKGIHHLQFPLLDRLVNCAYQTCNVIVSV